MISIETRNDLTIFHLSGEVTLHDLLAQVTLHMTEQPTPMALWDLLEVSRLNVTTAEIKAAATELKSISTGKMPRTVAFVEFREVNMGLAKIFIAFAQMAGVEHHYRVFRRMEDAMDWLDSQR